MSTVPPFKSTICRFHIDLPSTLYYLCNKDEICCRQGCCSDRLLSDDYKLLNTYWFWFGFIALLLIYFCLPSCCEKLEKLHKQQSSNPNNEQLDIQLYDNTSYNPRCIAPPIDNNENNDQVDEHGPPPIYSLAIHYPKPGDLQQQSIPNYYKQYNVNNEIIP